MGKKLYYPTNLPTIGMRAAWAIEERKVQTRKSMLNVRAEIDVTTVTLSNWRCGNTEPRGYHLRLMALAGYDVMWILTGEEDGKR